MLDGVLEPVLPQTFHAAPRLPCRPRDEHASPIGFRRLERRYLSFAVSPHGHRLLQRTSALVIPCLQVLKRDFLTGDIVCKPLARQLANCALFRFREYAARIAMHKLPGQGHLGLHVAAIQSAVKNRLAALEPLQHRVPHPPEVVTGNQPSDLLIGPAHRVRSFTIG